MGADGAAVGAGGGDDPGAARPGLHDRACTEEGALCTSDGRALSTGLAHLVLGPPPGGVPLTASFEDVPGEHDGSTPFELRLEFSEEVALSYATLRDHGFAVTGGAVTGARRTEPGSNAGWRITVEPGTNEAVTVTLPARACGETGACVRRRTRRSPAQ